MDVIEQEEFRFWFEQYGVGNVSGTQVIFGVFCNGVWVMVIVLQGVRFKDVVMDNQGGVGEEWVNYCGGCVWYQYYVGFVNVFLVVN